MGQKLLSFNLLFKDVILNLKSFKKKEKKTTISIIIKQNKDDLKAKPLHRIQRHKDPGIGDRRQFYIVLCFHSLPDH